MIASRNCIVLPIRKSAAYGDIFREGFVFVELRTCEVLRIQPSQIGEITLSFIIPSRLTVTNVSFSAICKSFKLCSDCTNKVNIDTNWINVTYRGSYMSAHVLLNLLSELGKRNKMRGVGDRLRGGGSAGKIFANMLLHS